MGRVVVVGLDAMDASIVGSLVDRGELPTLAGLLRDGVRAPTHNPDGLVVGGVWPSLATATWPARHGFYCFRQFEAGTYRIRRFTPYDVHGPTLWSALSEAGKRCCIVDAPLTAPARGLRGVQVVDWGTHDRMLEPSTVPEALLDELLAQHASHPVLGKCDDYAARGDWAGLQTALARGAAAKTDLCIGLLDREPWDLFLAVYGETHCAGHQFWSLHDPAWGRRDPASDAVGDALVATYAAVDRQLGRLLEHVDPVTSIVVLLSHGIGPHHYGDHLVAEIVRRLEGSLGLASPLRRAVEVGARRADRIRRAVQRRVRPGDRRLVGATNVDGSRRFFPVPNNELYAGVRVNLRGREPRGRVEPADLDATLGWLAERFLELVDADDGRPLVHRVIRTDDLPGGERRDHLPDLLIDWHREQPVTSAASPAIGVVRGTYSGIRTGDHRPAGLVVARAPGAPGRMLTRAIDVVDLAPTIAAHLGVTFEDVDGVPVPDLLAPDPPAAAPAGAT